MNSQKPATSWRLPHSRLAKSHDRRESTGFKSGSLCLLVVVLLPAVLRAKEYQVIAKEYFHTFSATRPALLRIKPGDVVDTKTVDSSGHDYQGGGPE